MITVQPQDVAERHLHSIELVHCSSPVEFFSAIHSHLHPLNLSSNSPDRRLYQNAKDSINYFSDRLSLDTEKILRIPSSEINNWQFLNLLACGWREIGVASGGKNCTPMDLTQRTTIEDIGVRVLNKYDILRTNFLKNQTNFSIYWADIAKMRKSLREVMVEEGKISPESFFRVA